MMNAKGNENNSKEQLLEQAKAKLQWYTMEADDEEFDEEEVDLLVQLINKLESKSSAKPQEMEEKLERFRAYVDFYKEDEAARNHENGEVENAVEAEDIKTIENVKETEKKFTKQAGRIVNFPGKKIVVAAAACLILLIIAGSSLGEVNADENTGFFHWLKKDKEGILAVTSPEKNGIEMNEVVCKEYTNMEELPEEYRQYVIEKESISHLQEYEFQYYWCEDARTFRLMEEVFENSDGEMAIRLGVVIYPDRTMILREVFKDYDYLYTTTIEGKEQEVFLRVEESGKKRYVVSFYVDNKKYFVSGYEDVELLEAISEEYMNLVFD